MRLICLSLLVALSALVWLASDVSFADDKKGGKSDKGGFHGKVTNVHLTDKHHGTIRVKELKGGASRTAVEKTFQVDDKTKIHGKHKGGKKGKGGAKMTLDQIKVGHEVTVHAKGDRAVSIHLGKGKSGKGKK